MAIKKFEDYRVEEDYMSNLEYIKEFELLSKEYRMGCEFEYLGGIDFKVVKETPVIYCYNNKVAIYPKDKEVCIAHIMTSINFEKRFKDKGIEMIKHEEEMLDGKIRSCYQWGENGEFTLEFYTKDIDKVVEIFKIRKANKTSNKPHSIRNLHDFLRFHRNISPWYGEILEQRFLANKTDESD